MTDHFYCGEKFAIENRYCYYHLVSHKLDIVTILPYCDYFALVPRS